MSSFMSGRSSASSSCSSLSSLAKYKLGARVLLSHPKKEMALLRGRITGVIPDGPNGSPQYRVRIGLAECVWAVAIAKEPLPNISQIVDESKIITELDKELKWF